tara:strand:- start:208 stop:660 length:453 start_codon:yes stop_codon:yes gene_type:complete
MRIINFFFLLLTLAGCVRNDDQRLSADLVQKPNSANEQIEDVKVPIIAIEKDFFDFGELNQNESISTDFLIKNIGNAPLLVRSVKGSCGCTVAEWPKELIEVGESAKIKVTFNSGTKRGRQNKTVTLVTNSIPSTKVLIIKGTILVSKNI